MEIGQPYTLTQIIGGRRHYETYKRTGIIVYIHPEHRFICVEFPGKFGGTYRECFMWYTLSRRIKI